MSFLSRLGLSRLQGVAISLIYIYFREIINLLRYGTWDGVCHFWYLTVFNTTVILNERGNK